MVTKVDNKDTGRKQYDANPNLGTTGKLTLKNLELLTEMAARRMTMLDGNAVKRIASAIVSEFEAKPKGGMPARKGEEIVEGKEVETSFERNYAARNKMSADESLICATMQTMLYLADHQKQRSPVPLEMSVHEEGTRLYVRVSPAVPTEFNGILKNAARLAGAKMEFGGDCTKLVLRE
ncbi:MAG: hypothetical protein WCY41_04555 [Candidatus Micrarchaeia archaeon]